MAYRPLGTVPQPEKPVAGWLVASFFTLRSLVVGVRNGLMARGYRASVGAMAAYLEKFDPPSELAPIVIPPDPKKIPEGPWMPGEQPPESLPMTIAWFHPLAGPRRALPNNESRR